MHKSLIAIMILARARVRQGEGKGGVVGLPRRAIELIKVISALIMNAARILP